jgi:hypothetical protein
MNNIYITVIIVCAFIIIKLYYENKKLKSKLFNNEDQLVVEDKNHTESVNSLTSVADISIDERKSTSAIPSKNAFLHCNDNFGRMEKGVVLNDKTYTYEKDDSFEIQPAPKKRRNKK